MSKRVSLILKDSDEVAIASYLTEGSVEFEVLNRWAVTQGIGEVTSEASGLRALLQAGVQALREQALDIGYEELARDFNAPELGADRRAARDRYVAREETRR